jgi:hypothetical protein
MSWERFDVAPFSSFARWEDLQSPEAVEEDCDGAKIAVGSDGHLVVVPWLRRAFYEADLVARERGLFVKVGERGGWEVEVVVEVV